MADLSFLNKSHKAHCAIPSDFGVYPASELDGLMVSAPGLDSLCETATQVDRDWISKGTTTLGFVFQGRPSTCWDTDSWLISMSSKET